MLYDKFFLNFLVEITMAPCVNRNLVRYSANMKNKRSIDLLFSKHKHIGNNATLSALICTNRVF